MRVAGAALALWALAASAAPGRTLAVTYFDVHAQDPELRPLAKGLADLLLTDLAAVRTLQVVEREKLNQALDELKLAQSPFVDPKSAVSLGKGLSATHLLTGSLTVVGKTMRITARVFEVETGKVVTAKDVEGGVDLFFALEKELAELLVQALTLSPTVEERAALRKAQTESFDAFRRYAQGLDALDRGQREAARDAFAKASAADPAWRRAKAALESLEAALARVDQRRALSLQDALAALRPDDPGLDEALRKLAAPEDRPYAERDLVKLEVLGHCARAGLKPWKPRTPRSEIGASARTHWEAEELHRVVSAFGDAPQAVRAAPVVLEYLVRKYQDDPTFLASVRHTADRLARVLEKVDLAAPVPELPGSGDTVERRRAHHAFLVALAADVPLPRGTSRDPKEAAKRTLALLEQEKARREALFASEFDRRVGALRADAPNAELRDALQALRVAAQEYDGERVERSRRQLQLSRWLVDHPAARPYAGTAARPHWLETWDLLRWIGRCSADPECWDAVGPAGEYLLAKYPDASEVPSQLKLHLRAVEERRKDLPATRRHLEAERAREPDLALLPEIRALLLRAGEAGRARGR